MITQHFTAHNIDVHVHDLPGFSMGLQYQTYDEEGFNKAESRLCYFLAELLLNMLFVRHQCPPPPQKNWNGTNC